MPKVFGKEIPPIALGGASVLAAALVYTQLLAPPDAPRKTTKKTTKISTKKLDAYRPEDYTIKFVSNTSSQPLKDTFQPLVVRKTSLTVGTPGSPPITFAGEGGWVFTGTATVNGVMQAVLENPKKGDAEFVVEGQHWKNSVVADITPDAVTLNGPGGAVFTMAINMPTEQGEPVDVSANGAPVTVPPGLMGQIGSGDLSVQPTQGNNGGNGNGRRRGRRNWMNNQNQGF